MVNERLRSQLSCAAMSGSQVAQSVGVDPKTVERWIRLGRLPHPRHRRALSALLAVEEAYLWPELLHDRRAQAASTAEMLTLYPHRIAVPEGVWARLITSAKERVNMLAYAALFLFDSHPDLPRILAERAQDGLKVRLLYGDPDSETVAWRGREEGIGDHLAARIRLSLSAIAPALDCPQVEVRLHSTVLYNSLYRFDDEMLVNTHVMGSQAPHNPVLHLRRVPGGQLFDHYLLSFDRVWEAATPWHPEALKATVS